MHVTAWGVAATIAIIGLAAFFRGKNPVWGGATLGGFGGCIAMLFTGYSAVTIGKGIVVGALVGLAIEILVRGGRWLRAKWRDRFWSAERWQREQRDAERRRDAEERSPL